MTRLPAALFCATLALSAQQKPSPPKPSPPKPSPQEQADLEKALSDAGGNPAEYLRAIEKHLAKYPNSPRRPELERAAARAAVQAGDDGRTILYGERVLARDSSDLQVLESVTRALLKSDSPDNAERALRYARRLETIIAQTPAGGNKAEWQNQTDRRLATALRFEARATGNLGRFDEAQTLARRSFETYPNAESAREEARWLERLGRQDDAVRALADAFTIPDPNATDADRARDRGRMGELYAKLHGSEAGLGDLVLAAYDRNVALLHARELRLRNTDPNAGIDDPMQFTLAGVDGAKLQMADLKGKVLVLDFWATWCAPCRAQHPLYEQVVQRFHDNPGVVFLSLDCD
ncbi:MAG TPA: TlpA disulfide reductase family protein, partial [Candidatus Sulfopaludibacter sp.]|nr:TlpA disulfide reductase family protein [Candidatus Sulfopaludibacter sp.]